MASRCAAAVRSGERCSFAPERMSPLAIGRENARLRPVAVIDLVDEDLDALGSDPVGVDERFGDARHQMPLQFDVPRRLLHGHDRQDVPPPLTAKPAVIIPRPAGRRANLKAEPARLLR